MSKIGGLSELKNSDDMSDIAVYNIRETLEKKEGKVFSIYNCHSYKTQVVAGINIFAKIHVGNDNYYHVRIYKDLNNEYTLVNYHKNKKEEDVIEYISFD